MKKNYSFVNQCSYSLEDLPSPKCEPGPEQKRTIKIKISTGEAFDQDDNFLGYAKKQGDDWIINQIE